MPPPFARPEPGEPDDKFVDLYLADVAVPTIGRSLLGDDGYNRLAARLKPGQQALVVRGAGSYSFKGSGYVRGGIFDRIELVQEGNSIRFRDRHHTRLGALAAEGAPDFSEIALFVVPMEFAFDPTAPWALQILVQRVVGARDKAVLTFDLGYALPQAYMKRAPQTPTAARTAGRRNVPAASPAPSNAAAASFVADEEPLWIKIWRGDVVKIGITVAGARRSHLDLLFSE
jgi:NosR/NirI family nitrous oxide reductase transcriptional regulator